MIFLRVFLFEDHFLLVIENLRSNLVALILEIDQLCGMMRRAFFGTNALILLAFHLILILLDVFQVLPYVATLFYVMINIMALMLAVLGYWERDKLKFPGLIGLILGSGALIFWVVALVLRIQSAGG